MCTNTNGGCPFHSQNEGLGLTDNTPKKTALEKLQERATEAESKKSHLSPMKHKQLDFFIADMFDTVNFSGDMASMEHPIFALKAGDTKTRFYEHNNVSVEVNPTRFGIATIHDKDIWIFCISKLMQGMYEKQEISRTVHFTAYDFLVTTNRGTGGREYELLKNSLERLRGTSITTTIKTGNRLESNGFGLIDSWKIIKEDDNGNMVNLSITLPDWLFRSVAAKEVLTISADYFRLRKPLDRRVYELARKHCGQQAEWKISLDLLHKKTGSMANIRKFKMNIKSLVETNDLPDYAISFDGRKNLVIFSNRNPKNLIKGLIHGIG